MDLTSPAQALEIESGARVPPPPTHSQRWTDLTIVLASAFALPILGSIYRFLGSVSRLFQPTTLAHTNAQILIGLIQEVVPLIVFAYLLAKQRRKVRSVGLSFQLRDLLRALGLTGGALLAAWAAYYGLSIIWIAATHSAPKIIQSESRFEAVNPWLLFFFLMLNPFFEEILVRGYLMTEIFELRQSMPLAVAISLGIQTSYHLYYGWFGALVVGAGLSVFALYYARSRRLWPIILAHMLWDLTALAGAWHR